MFRGCTTCLSQLRSTVHRYRREKQKTTLMNKIAAFLLLILTAPGYSLANDLRIAPADAVARGIRPAARTLRRRCG